MQEPWQRSSNGSVNGNDLGSLGQCNLPFLPVMGYGVYVHPTQYFPVCTVACLALFSIQRPNQKKHTSYRNADTSLSRRQRPGNSNNTSQADMLLNKESQKIG